jgi:hypothetical protein
VRRCVWPTTTTNPPASPSPPQWLQQKQKPEGQSPLIARPAVFSPPLSSSNIPRHVTCIYVYNIYYTYISLCNCTTPQTLHHEPTAYERPMSTLPLEKPSRCGHSGSARAPQTYLYILYILW